MSQFRDRKKRIALAMGLASFFGAGRFSMAKGKPVKGNTEVSASNPNANKGFFTNLTTGKKIGMAASGVGLAALTYEVIADTAGKNTGMPSIGKKFGWVKKQDDQKKDKKDDQKKDDQKDDQKKDDQKDDQKKDKKDDKKKDDSEGDKSPREICGQISGWIGSYGKVLEDDKGLKKDVAIKLLVETAKLAGIKKETLTNSKGNNHKVYCFLAPIARKIGLSEERFSDDNIWNICCHNFAKAKSNALNFKVKGVAITQYEQGALMLISQLRNIMNYNAGCRKNSNFIEGDLLTALQAL